MMINFVQGNLFHADVEALVNTVNCVGVMGRGIALQFKKAFPENFQAYKKACDLQQVVPGKMFIFETGSPFNPRLIINFPTKRHWRSASKIEDIDAGLDALITEIRTRKIRSIAIPPLGAGLGGLEWPIVKNKIIEKLSPISEDISIFVYEPIEKSAHNITIRSEKKPKMTEGRAILISLMDEYLKKLIDPYITLLELHKLMYFVQESGYNLRLRFTKGLYGPYAENLRHVLQHIEGHYISGYQDGGDNPKKIIELMPNVVTEAHHVLKQNNNISSNFKRVNALIEGFESSAGLELLATTHWLKKQEKISDLHQGFYSWNQHKQQFSKRQIDIAEKVLTEKGWI